jgi:predicted GIY-YIG superfamily endonuclease
MSGFVTSKTKFKRKIIGIYILKSPKSDNSYVGSSIHCMKRINQHFWGLKNKKHRNKILQKAFNKHRTLEFYIVWTTTEKIHVKYPWMIREIEENFIDDLSGKRYNLTNNTYCPPKDKKVGQKISKTLKGRKWTKERRVNHKIALSSPKVGANMSRAQKGENFLKRSRKIFVLLYYAPKELQNLERK